MADNQPPVKSSWMAWLTSFTPLEVLFSCTFIVATAGFILALVARILLPTSGCVDPCQRDFPKEFQPMLSRRYQRVPDDNGATSRIGQSPPTWKINEHRELRAGEFPFLGSINVDNEVKCMMIIVSQRWCMTTADCLRSINTSEPYSLMERDMQGALIGGYGVLMTDVHKHYKAGYAEYDIAVIQSASDFKLHQSRFFVFPTKYDDLDLVTGNMIVLMGWGPKSKGAQAVVNCWSSIVPWNKKMNITADVGDKAGVLVYGQKVLCIVSKRRMMIRLSQLKDWVQETIKG